MEIERCKYRELEERMQRASRENSESHTAHIQRASCFVLLFKLLSLLEV
jgi:hypothetical protein